MLWYMSESFAIEQFETLQELRGVQICELSAMWLDCLLRQVQRNESLLRDMEDRVMPGLVLMCW